MKDIIKFCKKNGRKSTNLYRQNRKDLKTATEKKKDDKEIQNTIKNE